MKNFKQTATVLTTLGAVVLTATPAMAQEMKQNQKLDQDFNVVCTTGAYGQNSECTVEGSQTGEQYQKMVLGDEFVTLADGTTIRVHNPVDTGLDTYTQMAVAAIFVFGLFALVAKKNLVK